MRNGSMRHGRHQDNIDLLTGSWRLDVVPLVEIRLLKRYLALVQLPVLVDGNGLAFVDQCFYVRYEGLSAS